MTHSFPFEQFQCDTRRPRQGEPRHGCLAVTGKKADETPGTKEMRQGLWGARAVTCIVCRRRVSPSRSTCASSAPPSPPPPQFLAASAIPVSFSLPVSATVSAPVLLQPASRTRSYSPPTRKGEGAGTIAVGGVRVHRAASRHA